MFLWKFHVSLLSPIIYLSGIIKLRGVSTELYFNLIFTMQSYKDLIVYILSKLLR